MASILMPPPKAKSDYGINFDATEKFFSEALYFSLSHDLPLEGDFKKFFGSTHKNRPSYSLLSEGTKITFKEA